VGSLYDRIAGSDDGRRALSAARLRYRVLEILHNALRGSGLTQSDLAVRLRIRKSAVNQVMRGDGNVRVSTLGEYLHELGFEAQIELMPLGAARRAALADMNETAVKLHGAVPVRRTRAQVVGPARVVWQETTPVFSGNVSTAGSTVGSAASSRQRAS
jgi:transcriptional regulator with XRE-family HTH domain